MQLRQPRLAEMVAGALRQRILGGQLTDGDLLPKQEELLEEFKVSKPSIREALRILETEGLITVQRGNVGGAVVHVPKAESAAYMLGLVLESQDVQLHDVGLALTHLEPLCAGLCAEREDRHEAVLPALRRIQEETIAAMGDELEFTRLTRQFHEELVARCGNATMILVIGALEALWSAHEHEWATRVHSAGAFPDASVGKASLHAHDELIALIDAGDAANAARVAREHLQRSLFYAVSGREQARVRSRSLRDSSPTAGSW
ncbi:MAG TPA: GntR family transcriptional regulator [Acidimicrobiales bacterium]